MHRLKDLIIVCLCGGLLFVAGIWVGKSDNPVTVHAQSTYPGDRYQIFAIVMLMTPGMQLNLIARLVIPGLLMLRYQQQNNIYSQTL